MTVHLLYDPWAPHPVVNKNICYGMGGGGGGSSDESFTPGNAPSVPDYSQYIAHMGQIGDKLTGYGADLYKWAQDAGIKVSGIADTVSGRAGELADAGAQSYKDMMAKWKSTYGDIYDAQAADAKRMIGELPQTEEQYAGKYQADVAQAFDASKAASTRNLQSYGLKAPGSGAQALDTMVSNQRGLAQVAAGEQGRLAARTEARGVAKDALASGQIFPTLANQGQAMALAAGNQEVGAPESAISTTVGAYSPTMSAYGTALPYEKTWGDTMSNEYNQRLAGYNAYNTAMSRSADQKAKANEAAGGSGGAMMGLAGGLLGSVAGSVVPGVGTALGGMLGSSIGGMAGKAMGAKGGSGEDFARIASGSQNGENFVDPSSSPSEGAITDDVPARLNAGEFVFPKDVVAWRGEQWMQKEIMKARKERDSQTEAEPEMAPAGAIDMQAPTFRSEGAQV